MLIACTLLYLGLSLLLATHSLGGICTSSYNTNHDICNTCAGSQRSKQLFAIMVIAAAEAAAAAEVVHSYERISAALVDPLLGGM